LYEAHVGGISPVSLQRSEILRAISDSDLILGSP
jgi:hypothetical protein